MKQWFDETEVCGTQCNFHTISRKKEYTFRSPHGKEKQLDYVIIVRKTQDAHWRGGTGHDSLGEATTDR